MGKRTFGIPAVFLCGLLFVLSGLVQAGDYTYTLTALDSHEFLPSRNTYEWRGTSKFEGQTGHIEFTCSMIYYKVPDNLVVQITSRNTATGKVYVGAFKASCTKDPVLFDNVTCGSWQKTSGEINALPTQISHNEKTLCALGPMFFSPGLREALRQEYLAIIQGPFTLAPMPVSPKENAKIHSPVVFEAFLPFRVALPCRGWYLTILLERYDPRQSGYPWDRVPTGDAVKGWEGDHFQCRFKKEMPLKPGKYRFKLQAEHFQQGKTPWSLPFEFAVVLEVKPGIIKAKRLVVTAPKSGEMWRIRKDPYYVNWHTYSLPQEVLNGRVEITLHRGLQEIAQLHQGVTAKTKRARVYLKGDLPTGSGFYVRVRSLVDNKYYGDSGKFSIVKLNPRMRVRTP